MQKIDFFKEKMVLRAFLIKLTFRWLQTGLSDLKNTKTIEILLPGKIVKFTYFYLNTVGQTQ